LFGGLLFLLFLQKQTSPIEYMPANYYPLSVLIPTYFSKFYSDVSEAFCFGNNWSAVLFRLEIIKIKTSRLRPSEAN
jgi:hypothetical protein